MLGAEKKATLCYVRVVCLYLGLLFTVEGVFSEWKILRGGTTCDGFENGTVIIELVSAQARQRIFAPSMQCLGFSNNTSEALRSTHLYP